MERLLKFLSSRSTTVLLIPTFVGSHKTLIIFANPNLAKAGKAKILPCFPLKTSDNLSKIPKSTLAGAYVKKNS